MFEQIIVYHQKGCTSSLQYFTVHRFVDDDDDDEKLLVRNISRIIN